MKNSHPVNCSILIKNQSSKSEKSSVKKTKMKFTGTNKSRRKISVSFEEKN